MLKINFWKRKEKKEKKRAKTKWAATYEEAQPLMRPAKTRRARCPRAPGRNLGLGRESSHGPHAPAGPSSGSADLGHRLESDGRAPFSRR
jgi:hypothetical protein